MDFRPTAEELQNPHRTIRNLKMLIHSYQRKHAAHLKNVERLQDMVCEVLDLPKSDFEIASSRRLRHDVRKFVAVLSEEMRKTKTNLKLGPAAATKGRTKRGVEGDEGIKTAINDYDSYAKKNPNSKWSLWNLEPTRISQILHRAIDSGAIKADQVLVYKRGTLTKKIRKLQKERSQGT